MKELHLVFTAFPRPGGECVFVETEDANGRSVNCGEWRQRADGLVELVITELPDTGDSPGRPFLVKSNEETSGTT